jgi:hypothetical protein
MGAERGKLALEAMANWEGTAILARTMGEQAILG